MTQLKHCLLNLEVRIGLLLLLTVTSCIGFTQSSRYPGCTSVSGMASNKTASTLNGPVRGECNQVTVSYSNSSDITYDIFSWVGIPYAQPPLGSNRFMRPKPVKSWTNIRDAIEWPNPCKQTSFGTGGNPTSEDCLYLNIFARDIAYLNNRSPNELRPVMVWIHGGFFVSGSSALDQYEPSTLVAANDVIVVTLNYRLGKFGFFYSNESSANNNTGNAGFLDQSMALKWVFENIKSFGGDNSRITIFGGSAGSFSVGFHLFYADDWAYFSSAIMESGSPTSKSFLLSADEATQKATQLFKEIGCGNATSFNEKLVCAQAANANAILNATPQINQLVIDGQIFTKSIQDLANEGNFKKCPIISGFNSDEQGFFVPFTIGQAAAKNMNYGTFENLIKALPIGNTDLNQIYTKYIPSGSLNNIQNLNSSLYLQTYFEIANDATWKCSAFDVAELYASASLGVYMYEYAYGIESSRSDAAFGIAVHADEVPIVFGEPLSNKPPSFQNQFSYNYSVEAKRFSETVMNYWTNFAKYNDPNYSKSPGDSQYWQALNEQSTNLNTLTAAEKLNTARYLRLTNDAITTVTGFGSHQCDFWNYTKNGDLVDTITTTIGANNLANSNVFSSFLVLILAMVNFVTFF